MYLESPNNNEQKNKVISELKNKLLDTSARNPLINFKYSRSSVIQLFFTIEKILNQIENSKPSTIYNVISLGEGDIDQRSGTVFLETTLHAADIKRILTLLERKGRLMFEEQGINVIFISLGILKWTGAKGEQLHSPIAFIPVKLERGSSVEKMKIKITNNENLDLNLSLNKKILNECGLKVEIEPSDFEGLSLSQSYKLIESKYRDLVDKANANSPIEQWEILDESHIGLFKFASIEIYNDVVLNEDKIKDSRILDILVNNVEDDGSKMVDEDRIDQLIDPLSYFHSLPTNSSQEAAIQSAVAGASFIIQGPPGTGKSQTIANIISELVARNKKILFVAEKRAALDVVNELINKIGFGDYVLNMHNDKLEKRAFIKDLNDTLNKSAEYSKVSENYHSSRINSHNFTLKSMNDFKTALLTKRGRINRSIYELIGEHQKYINLKADELKVDIQNIESLDLEQYSNILREINSFQSVFESINYDFKNNPWKGFYRTNLNILERENLSSFFYELKQELIKLSSSISSIIPSGFDSSISVESAKTEMLQRFFDISASVDKLNYLENYRFLLNSVPNSLIEQLELLIKEREVYEKLAAELSQNYNLSIIDTQNHKFLNQIEDFNNPLKRFFSGQYRQIKKAMQAHKIIKKVTYQEVVDDLEILEKIAQSKEKMKPIVEQIELISKLKVKDVELNKLIFEKENCQYYIKFNEALDLSGVRFENKNNLANIIANQAQNLQNYYANYSKFSELKQKFSEYFSDQIFEYKIDTQTIKDVIFKLDSLLSHNFNYDDFSKFRESYNDLYTSEYTKDLAQKSINLDPMSLKNAKLEDIYAKRFIRLLTDKYIYEFMPNWNSAQYEQIIKEYKEVLDDLATIAKYRIIENISQQIPNSNGTVVLSDVRMIKEQAAKQRNQKPIREFFKKEYYPLIQKLKPCFMMSPSSVSSFFSSSDIKFDVVIFDEASQLRTENAVCSLMRAEQFIIAGDTKQLPPTNFFQVSDSILEEYEISDEGSESDYDSILERLQGRVNEFMLKWHYRSRFEELIAPSNEFIYENKLITFPSAKKVSTNPQQIEGVKFIKVNGLYDSSTNEIEADKIVEVLKELRDKFGASKTIGVVTFNLKQASLIEDKLTRMILKQPQYQSLETENKLFIKNIETVQGDERDIIILGITNGPNARGYISMNFGPLNLSGGEKRLNVATTRAKDSTIVVSSISYSDLRVDDLKNEGVKFLKQYLKYAEFGFDQKVDNVLEDTKTVFDSPFEIEVYNEIKKLGYELKSQVGCSRFKIDLGVVDPENPARFVLGIECDGATYHSSRSARDRDLIRQGLLESRGWKIYRIWSTNWFKNREFEVSKLNNAIKEAIASKDIETPSDDFVEQNHNLSNVPVIEQKDDFIPTEIVVKETLGENVFKKSVDFNEVVSKVFEIIKQNHWADDMSVRWPKDNIKNVNLITSALKEVFEYENTIDSKVIQKYFKAFLDTFVRSYFGNQKDILAAALNNLQWENFLVYFEDAEGKIFYHKLNTTWEPRVNYRPNHRRIVNLSPQEICYLIIWVISQTNSITQEDLVFSVIKIFDVINGAQNREFVEKYIIFLQNRSIIRINDEDKLELPRKIEGQKDIDNIIFALFEVKN
ncbi:DUF4011 domain-containing protein [Mycoplasma procyoni]|uniref:DUF4011 domain-containing protein n=1 Tax=Mycoplasma procyoni TaxID=568784 RepID=UPI00197B7D6A|nr:DUF4011 domain-containing protein [Mycoplasma procyoni]MBN3534793.1 DUF4011 domain-containing protein [Mycoplasma procyoni]